MNTTPIPSSPAPAPDPRGPGFRRNHFHALFEQVPLGPNDLAPPVPAVARVSAPVSAPVVVVTQPAPVQHSSPVQPPPPPQRPVVAVTTPRSQQEEDPIPGIPEYYHRSSDLTSLEPLLEAMRRAGLDPGKFQFEQVEAFQEFPEHPELSFTHRQIVIRGPSGMGMFDRDLALRTPWVTVVELKTYGIA